MSIMLMLENKRNLLMAKCINASQLRLYVFVLSDKVEEDRSSSSSNGGVSRNISQCCIYTYEVI